MNDRKVSVRYMSDVFKRIICQLNNTARHEVVIYDAQFISAMRRRSVEFASSRPIDDLGTTEQFSGTVDK